MRLVTGYEVTTSGSGAFIASTGTLTVSCKCLNMSEYSEMVIKPNAFIWAHNTAILSVTTVSGSFAGLLRSGVTLEAIGFRAWYL